MYKRYEDFSIWDDEKQPYSLETERTDNYTHHHGGVTEQGYAITCPGGRHILKSPRLGTFQLAFDVLFEFPIWGNLRWGVLLGYDKVTRCGTKLVFSCESSTDLKVAVVGLTAGKEEQIACAVFPGEGFESEKVYYVSVTRTETGIQGTMGTLFFTFSLNPEEGNIGFFVDDTAKAVVFSKVCLESGDEIERITVWPYREVTIPCMDGGMLDYVLGVSVDCLQQECYELNYVLKGGINGKERKELDVDCWIVQHDAFYSPYIRLAGQKKTPNLYMKNGELIAFDPSGFGSIDLTKMCRSAVDFPITGSVMLNEFDPKSRLVFGYERKISFGYEYYAGGREYIYDREGNLLYHGKSINSEWFLEVSSGAEKQIVKRIPKDTVDYEKAVAHAIGNHYFFSDEAISFQVKLHTVFSKKYLRIVPRLENVYGEKIADLDAKIVEMEDPLSFTGLSTAFFEVSCPAMSVGVYRLVTGIFYGEELLEEHLSVFEVFDADSAQSPQAAVGLPYIYVGDGTPFEFEGSCPDPWSAKPDFNIGHYVNCAQIMPDTAERRRAWELLKLYRRDLYVWLTKRTIGTKSITEYPGCLTHADYLNCPFPGIEDSPSNYCRYDNWRHSVYTKTVLAHLQNFLDENPDVAEKIGYISVQEEFTAEMLNCLLDVAGDTWIPYLCAKTKELFLNQWREIKKNNPKARRSAYGPWPVYMSPYQGGYSIKWFGFEPGTMDEIFDGYLQYEDYPFSAAYKTHRGAWGLMTTKLLCKGIKIFPEIYESFYEGCPDGAVAYAYPPLGKSDCPPYFTVTQAFEAVFNTAYWKNGQFDYWRDYGFMMFTLGCQYPKERFEGFVKAWGNVVSGKPVRPLRSVAFVANFSAEDDRLDREYHGDDRYNICEAAEGYLYGCMREWGLPSGFVTDFESLLDLNRDMTDLLVLPSMYHANEETIQKIRGFYEEGVSLVAVGDVTGLEDLFGVERKPGRHEIYEIHTADEKEYVQPFEAEFFYAPVGAEILLASNDVTAPVLLKKGNAMLLNTSIGHVGVDAFLKQGTIGRDNVSRLLKKVCGEQLFELSRPLAYAAQQCGLTLFENEKQEKMLLLIDYSDYEQTKVQQEKRVTVAFPQLETFDIVPLGNEAVPVNLLLENGNITGFSTKIRHHEAVLFKLCTR